MLTAYTLSCLVSTGNHPEARIVSCSTGPLKCDGPPASPHRGGAVDGPSTHRHLPVCESPGAAQGALEPVLAGTPLLGCPTERQAQGPIHSSGGALHCMPACLEGLPSSLYDLARQESLSVRNFDQKT